MTAISYAQAPVPVREDLVLAQRGAWRHIASPGAWWSGAERVAIAAEVREAERCALCRDRREALSPASVGGSHSSRGGLPDAAVDAVHRISTDPGRLSRAWFDSVRAQGISDGHYVELVGVGATVAGIDAFCRGLGVSPHPLPEPLPGEPSGYRPAGLGEGNAWVPMLPNGRPPAAESDLWEGSRTGTVVRALSLVPDEVRNLKRLSEAHYLGIDQVTDPGASRGPLDRAQMELVAGRVSALNHCFY